MKKKIERPPDDKEQSQRFVETAQKLEADESGEPFANALISTLRRSNNLLRSRKSTRSPKK